MAFCPCKDKHDRAADVITVCLSTVMIRKNKKKILLKADCIVKICNFKVKITSESGT